MDTIKSTAGSTINITANFTTNGERISSGKVVFKINDNTIGSTNISLGSATLTYTIPSNYSAKNYTITVVYGGSSTTNSARINTTLTLDKLATTPTVTVSNLVDGSTSIINVSVVDENGNAVTTGKVALKINGKTLVSTQTDNGVLNVTFDTSDFKNEYYNITIVFGENSAYNTLTVNTSLVVNKDSNATKVE